MPLTRDFKETVQTRAARDPAFSGRAAKGRRRVPAYRRRRCGQDRAARLHQRDHRIRGAGPVDEQVPQEFDADVQSRPAIRTPATCSRSSAAYRSTRVSSLK